MIDEHAATELKLYIDNDAQLYKAQATSILKNLATKRARGEYKHDLAVKAFEYLVKAGAKKYADEFEPTMRVWHQIFDASTRRAVAEAMAKDFESEAKLGNYDHLLPKKYQKPAAPSHARKKLVHGSGGHYVSGMPNMPKRAAQLDREIAQSLSRRGGR